MFGKCSGLGSLRLSAIKGATQYAIRDKGRHTSLGHIRHGGANAFPGGKLATFFNDLSNSKIAALMQFALVLVAWRRHSFTCKETWA